MGILFDLELARERRDELLHEAEERRLARALRRARRGEGRRGGPGRLESVEANWRLAEEEPTVVASLYRASRR
jgi:hypothetical protein